MKGSGCRNLQSGVVSHREAAQRGEYDKVAYLGYGGFEEVCYQPDDPVSIRICATKVRRDTARQLLRCYKPPFACLAAPLELFSWSRQHSRLHGKYRQLLE